MNKDLAASKIQALQRGTQARKEVRVKREEQTGAPKKVE